MTDPEAVLVAILRVPWRERAVAAAVREIVGAQRAPELAARLLERWPDAPRVTHAEILAGITTALGRRIVLDPLPPPRWRWPVQRWEDVDALAAGLDLRDGELDWFADTRGWLADGRLGHYRRRWHDRRLIEAPKPRLAELQRRVGRRVLAHIPVHDAAHGYVRGRSPLTLARVHAGQALVLRLDVEGFFTRIGPARIAGLLATAGYPAAVARTLAGLLVTATPPGVLRAAPAHVDAATRDRLRAPHLPQGAPTSPAVANVLAHGLDRRLTALAAAAGARYGRYADDLVFSGDTTLPVQGLLRRARDVAADEGFAVRPAKTRVMPAHHRQRVVGLVVNETPAVSRREFDALRALLHNCARTGPAAQNRDGHPDFRAHLLGRIGWVATGSPARAERLRALFGGISWD
ncbi:reverse transcriptase family protein [Pseudonocardia sp. N23]|uniref:reverse transcriptase family protein n=1 Tax=Pseudonocardia sp. N23 TaxID=1987376 RepID=UPI000C024449|nr:reverse transcriptase family protein [Pseudonocardia sp. N23]GAY10509.1 retron-type RNA-directed DNA polymerase [Pseudonocardia sp. N23]